MISAGMSNNSSSGSYVSSRRILPLTLALVLGAASSSSAAIINTLFSISVIGAPPSVQEDALQSDDTLFVFPELQDFVLTSDLRVNVTDPGDYGCGCILPFPVPRIAAGTEVDSYLVHADPVTRGFGYLGALTFDSDILGVMFGGMLLGESDPILGAPGTLYPTDPANRGLAIVAGQDFISISPDRRSILMAFITRRNYDQMRIVTAAQAPEPLTFVLLGGGLAMVAIRRRRLQRY